MEREEYGRGDERDTANTRIKWTGSSDTADSQVFCRQWKKKLLPLRIKRVNFVLPSWSVGGCCRIHLITVVGKNRNNRRTKEQKQQKKGGALLWQIALRRSG